MYNKSISAKLCAPVSGQAVMDVIVNPPQKGEPSYDQFNKEKQTVLAQLNEKVCLLLILFCKVVVPKCIISANGSCDGGIRDTEIPSTENPKRPKVLFRAFSTSEYAMCAARNGLIFSFPVH